jgi:uncharacterized glyoxalase superfamily protein PhnB
MAASQRGPCIGLALACFFVFATIPSSRSESFPVKKLTPLLVVEAIEPCLEFWVQRLGFEATTQVPAGDKLGFVILAHEGIEVMLQTRASVADDMPALAADPFHTALFVEVADLDKIKKAVEGMDLVFDERKTFYGSREICVRDPAGNVVTFAQFGEE